MSWPPSFWRGWCLHWTCTLVPVLGGGIGWAFLSPSAYHRQLGHHRWLYRKGRHSKGPSVHPSRATPCLSCLVCEGTGFPRATGEKGTQPWLRLGLTLVFLWRREWYGYHFPELIKIVSDNYTYCRLAKLIGNRKELSEESLEALEEIVMDSAKAQAILDASRSSMGQWKGGMRRPVAAFYWGLSEGGCSRINLPSKSGQ